MSRYGITQLAALLTVLVVSYIDVVLRGASGRASPTDRETAVAALSELRQWTTFLIGLQTGAITAMGVLFEKVGQSNGRAASLNDVQTTVGVVTLVFFGGSILAATWLLGAIPSLMLRLKDETCVENDFFHLPLFVFCKWPQVGPMTGLQYLLFSVGIVAFSTFVYLKL